MIITIMNNNQNSLFGSSVRSYNNLDNLQQNSKRNNFAKYLHTQQKLEQSQKYESNPMIVRNKSYDVFNSKIFDKPSRDLNPISQRFYESINISSQQKYINEVSNLQNEITKLMACQLGLKTEKDILFKEAKKLKEEVKYLNQKCRQLEDNNEQLFKSQSKVAIIQREYSKLLMEYEQFKNNCRLTHSTSTNLPSKIQTITYLADNHQSNDSRWRQSRFLDNRFSGKINPKVNTWRKQTTPATSPIYKLDQYNKKYVNRLEEVSLIQSKVDKFKDEEQAHEIQLQQKYFVNRNNAKTIDLKDLQKIKESDQSRRLLQSQIQELRTKNISLNKTSEQFEYQKMKLIEKITQLNFEKARMITQRKYKQNSLEEQLAKVRLLVEEGKSRISELNLIIKNKDENTKQLSKQKAEMEQNIKNMIVSQQKKQVYFQQNNKLVVQMTKNLQKSQLQLANLKQCWQTLNRRQQELQIENKLHIHQLQQQTQQMIRLQQEIEKLKIPKIPILEQMDLILKEESLLEKTEKKMQHEDIKKEQKLISIQIQTDADNKSMQEIMYLKGIHQQLINQHRMCGNEIARLKNQNSSLGQSYLQQIKLLEQQKGKSLKMRELNNEWRKIEEKVKTAKRIDLTINHLWQVKQVQYSNIHLILQNMK